MLKASPTLAFPFRVEGRLPRLTFSGPAQRSLALWPADSLSCPWQPFDIEGSRPFVAARSTPTASWHSTSFQVWVSHPRENRTFHGAHPKRQRGGRGGQESLARSIVEHTPHELPRWLGRVDLPRRYRICAEHWTLGKPPLTPALRVKAGDARFAALCVVRSLSRDGDGIGRLSYGVGIGVSWKPIAAALRWSAFSILTFILASYSSIDWTTYSWPYLSIL